jgi:hypothetical protein
MNRVKKRGLLFIIVLAVGCLIFFLVKRGDLVEASPAVERLQPARMQVLNNESKFEVELNGVPVEISLSLDELDGGVDLVKWAWPPGAIKEPAWLKGYQAMTDPRKFPGFEDYVSYTTEEWRVSTETNTQSAFLAWQNQAFSLSDSHDAKKVTILRVVKLKVLGQEYVYIAVRIEGMSPLTNSITTSDSMASIVLQQGVLKCADMAKDCLLIVNPEDRDGCRQLIASGRGIVSNKILKPIP